MCYFSLFDFAAEAKFTFLAKSAEVSRDKRGAERQSCQMLQSRYAFHSSKGTLARGEYAEETVKMAKANKDFVFGFIAQRCMVPDDPSFVYLTPGVQLAAGGDAMGQQVRMENQ
jgi:hypothetical protein